jgi:hypothetical protein
MRRILLESVALVVIVAISASAFVGTAAATVPTIVSVVNTSYVVGSPQASGSNDVQVYVKAQINHAQPTATHYVDSIEVDFMGATQQFAQKPQSSDSFSVDLFLGTVPDWQLANKPAARVRAHCTVDGWSAWSDPVPIPEFPVATIVAFAALAASLFITRRKPT